MQSLTNFVTSNGGDVSKTAVKHFSEFGNGLCATSDINKNEIIISIPYHIQINCYTLKKHWIDVAIPHLIEGDQDRDNINSIVYLYLAVNKYNQNCFHYPYISILPTTTTCPLSYSTEELNIIKHTKLHSAIEKTKEFLQKLVDYHNTILINSFPQYFSTIPDLFDRLVWAHQIFWSRAFSVYFPDPVGEIASLIPYADMSNHCSSTQITYVSNRIQEQFSLQNDEVPIRCGEQIYNNYRTRSNEKLLMDDYLLRVRIGDTNDSFDIIQTILKNENYQTLDFYLKLNEELPKDLIKLLRIVNLNFIESNQYIQGNIDLNFVSIRNEISAYYNLYKQLFHDLQLMQSVNVDFSLIDVSSTSYRVKCALIYKKSIIDIIKYSMNICQLEIQKQLTTIPKITIQPLCLYDIVFENFIDNLNDWAHQTQILHPSISYVNNNQHITLVNTKKCY
ncbi:SET domain-containing protein [Entamoeba marina]